jgi:hypothetical protein
MQLIVLVAYMEKFICGLMQTSLYNGSVWLKIGTAQQLSVEVSTIKFQNNA